MFHHSSLAGFLKSLKFRFIILIISVTLIPGILLSVGTLKAYEARAVSIRESEVLGQARILANQISSSEYLDHPKSQEYESLQNEISMLTSIYNGRVVIINQYYEIVEDTYNLDKGKTIITQQVMECFSGTESPCYDKENSYVELTVPITDGSADNQIMGVVLISASTDNIANIESYLEIIISGTAAGVMAVVIFAAILFALHMLVPFRKLSDGMEAIQNGYGDQLAVNNYTETRQISSSFNKVWSSMKKLDETRQEFVSNVSHELKTPMTSMKVLADSINSMPDAPLELYQEFMGDITNEIERESKIISDLLSLVKMDKSGNTLNITSVTMNDLLEQILKRLQPIAQKQHVDLVLESFRPVIAEIDEVKMTLAITNLVENAIKYNRDDGSGWVHVSLNADHQYFFIKVEDNGIGIPEESLDHIYERFYRADKSHSREIGGTGLGLAITRSSILLHRGAIKAHSVLGEGTTFDVRVPLSYIAEKF